MYNLSHKRAASGGSRGTFSNIFTRTKSWDELAVSLLGMKDDYPAMKLDAALRQPLLYRSRALAYLIDTYLPSVSLPDGLGEADIYLCFVHICKSFVSGKVADSCAEQLRDISESDRDAVSSDVSGFIKEFIERSGDQSFRADLLKVSEQFWGKRSQVGRQLHALSERRKDGKRPREVDDEGGREIDKEELRVIVNQELAKSLPHLQREISESVAAEMAKVTDAFGRWANGTFSAQLITMKDEIVRKFESDLNQVNERIRHWTNAKLLVIRKDLEQMEKKVEVLAATQDELSDAVGIIEEQRLAGINWQLNAIRMNLQSLEGQLLAYTQARAGLPTPGPSPFGSDSDGSVAGPPPPSSMAALMQAAALMRGATDEILG